MLLENELIVAYLLYKKLQYLKLKEKTTQLYFHTKYNVIYIIFCNPGRIGVQPYRACITLLQCHVHMVTLLLDIFNLLKFVDFRGSVMINIYNQLVSQEQGGSNILYHYLTYVFVCPTLKVSMAQSPLVSSR